MTKKIKALVAGLDENIKAFCILSAVAIIPYYRTSRVQMLGASLGAVHPIPPINND